MFLWLVQLEALWATLAKWEVQLAALSPVLSWQVVAAGGASGAVDSPSRVADVVSGASVADGAARGGDVPVGSAAGGVGATNAAGVTGVAVVDVLLFAWAVQTSFVTCSALTGFGSSVVSAPKG